MKTLIISNEELDDIMNIVKSLEESGLLINIVSQRIKNKAKEQKDGLVVILGASLSGNLLMGKGVKAKISRQGVVRAAQQIIRAGQDF